MINKFVIEVLRAAAGIITAKAMGDTYKKIKEKRKKKKEGRE